MIGINKTLILLLHLCVLLQPSRCDDNSINKNEDDPFERWVEEINYRLSYLLLKIGRVEKLFQTSQSDFLFPAPIDRAR